MKQMTGMLIGASGGTVFVFLNTVPPLDSTIALLLRVLAALAMLATLALWLQAIKQARATGIEPHIPNAPGGSGKMYGVGYLVIFIIEFGLIFGGTALFGSLGIPWQANVAWISLIVGLHFIALAPIWKTRTILIPGAILTLLGTTGLLLTYLNALPWIPFISGVLPGLTLLAGSLTSARLLLAAQTPSTKQPF